MTIDYDSHPADLANVKAGRVDRKVGIRDLRNAIPAHCFRPSLFRSASYLIRDIVVAAALAWRAFTYIPLVQSGVVRAITWAVYGFLQGVTFTGLWVIGHECGHGAFSKSPVMSDFFGFLTHSFLFTPYFSWKSSHRRHHIYANNMEMDHNYVPPRHDSYLDSIGGATEAGEDAPLYIIVRIILQQLLGWPLYLLANVTASPKSLARMKPSKALFGNSHFAPLSALFRPEEAHLVLASDFGLLAMAAILYRLGQMYGSDTMLLMYLQPYLWLNNWIVAVTYLHHTHPDIPKFDPTEWTFIKGATATIDRNFGFFGKHCLHNVIEFHVVHHLFSKIPHYHAEEATRAIQPLLGSLYHEDKQRHFLAGMWESFTKCQWVSPDTTKGTTSGTLWFRAGSIPPPEHSMGRKGWLPTLF